MWNESLPHPKAGRDTRAPSGPAVLVCPLTKCRAALGQSLPPSSHVWASVTVLWVPEWLSAASSVSLCAKRGDSAPSQGGGRGALRPCPCGERGGYDDDGGVLTPHNLCSGKASSHTHRALKFTKKEKKAFFASPFDIVPAALRELPALGLPEAEGEEGEDGFGSCGFETAWLAHCHPERDAGAGACPGGPNLV